MKDTQDKIKILIVAGRMDVGGIENQLMHLLRHADHSLFQIDFTTTDVHPFYEDEIVSLGSRCIHIPATEGKKIIRYCSALYRIMKTGNYDVVHSNELFHSGLVLMTARLAGVRGRIAHAHSSNQAPAKSLVRRCYTAVMRWLILHCSTTYLACSTLAAEFLYGKDILQSPNYHLVVNSVETRRFLPEAGSDSGVFPPSNTWKTVLQVGRFCNEKNYPLTVRIAAECKRRGDKIRFWFVGNDGADNPCEKEVKYGIIAEQLEDRVELLGIRKDVDALMRQADVFILPSKYEGMPLTLIEAQAACLPCVAADTFSHEVDFGAGSIEWLPLSAPVESWADAVERAAKRGKIDRNAICSAITAHGFDVSDFTNHLCKYYTESLGKQSIAQS